MLRKLLAGIFIAAGLMVPASAWASADFSCSVSWTLKPAALTDCDNHPFLSPTNDSRVNLQLLLLDAGKARLNPSAAAAKSVGDVWPPPVGPSPFTLGELNERLEPGAASASDETAATDGSRCNSNDAGARQFAAALSASKAQPREQAALLAARAALKPSCVDDPKAPPAAASPVQASSAAGKQFAAYLAGAAAFYDGRYDDAAQSFAALQASPEPWVNETARYMLGRVWVNRAQAGAFDEFGRLEGGRIDAKALLASRTAFNSYLRHYPTGAFAASARGLLRRVDWLGAHTADLALDFSRAFDIPDPKARNVAEVDLVQEADAKLLSDPSADAAAIRDPLLLAAFDLMHMRASEAKDDPKFVSQAALDAQRPVFVGREALFDYLRAVHAFYVDKAPGAALALLPKTAPTVAMTYLEFSRQVLRALALEETGDHAAARALWLALMPAARPPLQHAALELGLAMNYARAGAVDQVFAAGSPITDADLRELLLTWGAGPDLLRREAQAASVPEHERRVALYALLYKELTRNRYQAFTRDMALLPPPEQVPERGPAPDPNFAPFRWDGRSEDGYVCPALKDVAQSLAHDPSNVEARVCLDEFVRVGGLDDSSLDVPPSADVLGGAPSQFPGGPYSRLESYKALLADAKTPAAVRTYVLYRAVQCYAPSGYNHCGGKDVPRSQRKAWFQTLQAAYPGSVWAQRLKYYW